MTWIPDETRRMLHDSAAAFLAERAPVAHLRGLRDRAEAAGVAPAHDPALWREFATQGYCAVMVPEAHGGLGLGTAEAAQVAERIGRTLATTPFLSTAVFAAQLLARAGDDSAAAAHWLPRIASGEAVLAAAVDDGARHRPDALAARARRDGDGWVVDGLKACVRDAPDAAALLVAAAVDGEGTALLCVEPGTAGLGMEPLTLVDAHPAARVVLDGVRVGAGALLVEPAHGAAALDDALDAARAVAAAELVGVADEAFERTLEYLKARRQFDRAIGEFQALQHRMADLWCEMEMTRALVRQALQAVDDGDAAAPLRVAQAKARAAITGARAVQEAVQMHGGIGMTDELDIGLFMKRARVLQALWGDAGWQLERAARLQGY